MPESAMRKRCSKCGGFKAIGEFNRDARQTSGRRPDCRTCQRSGKSARYAASPAQRSRQAIRRRAWGQANPGRRYVASAEKRRASAARHRERTRAAVFGHYGTVCACCGATENLTIDHIGGDGGRQRQMLFGTSRQAGIRFYRWLIRNGFPDGFQTLCRPCNRNKGTSPRCWLDHSAPAC